MLARLRRLPWLPALAGVGTAVALVLSVIVLVNLTDLDTHNCRQIELVKARIRTVITQGSRTLGRPGSAGYAYYLAHPAELAAAQAGAQATLRTFAPGPC